MNFPLEGMKVFIEEDGQVLEYLNSDGEVETIKSRIKSVTNQEYEMNENDKKRNIIVLKPEYVGAFINDVKDMMRYKKSSQYLNSRTKKSYNPRKGK